MSAARHPDPRAAVPAGAAPLIRFHLVYFAAMGIVLPFLPGYFRQLGLSASEVGVLLAVHPVLALVVPQLWGQLADRTGRPAWTLALLMVGTTAAFSALLWTTRFPSLIAVVVAFACFQSGITTVLDSLTLHRVRLVGGAYTRIRLFGSVGFLIATVAFGLAVDQLDRRTVWAPLLLYVTAVGAALTLRSRVERLTVASPLAGLALLKQRDLALLLAACGLHWIACAPYQGFLSVHVLSLGLSPSVVGLSAGVGMVAEIAVMAIFPSLEAKLAPRHLLALAFAASGVRWVGMALTRSGEGIILLSVLHGLTFAAFYVAAVAFVARRVHHTLRATGQALLVSATFGLGGLLGFAGAGFGFDWVGGNRLYLFAAALELVPLALILRVRAPPTAPGPIDGRGPPAVVGS
jgi:MFS transporter, PPP family, 3-phenylpropionic acid transporter